MDSIIFSAKPTMAKVADAISHLGEHKELYWEVGFSIDRDKFTFPMLGFIHICGEHVEYKVTIQEIVPFSTEHYKRPLAESIKPEVWIREWEQNEKNVQEYSWKNVFVITKIEPFSFDTFAFLKYSDRQRLKKAPQSYTRVLLPENNDHC